MRNKGLILALMIVLSQVIFTIIQVLMMSIYDVSGVDPDLEGYTKVISIFLLVLRLVFPLILLTQFGRKDFYKYMAILLIVIALMRYLVSFAYGNNIYDYLTFTVSTINLLVLMTLMIIAFLKPEFKIVAILLIMLFINAFHNYQAVVWFQNEVLNIPGISIIRIAVTLLLFYGAMVSQIVLIVKESNKLKKESVELI